MKSFGNLFDKITSFSALHDAYMEVRKGKRASRQCAKFELRLEENLHKLSDRVRAGTYKPAPYIKLHVLEPKKRVIFAPGSFGDKVLQQALVFELDKIWEPRFISDSYACRVGKGTHAGANRAQQFLLQCYRKNKEVYALKADVRSYFASVRHDTLLGLVLPKIREEKLKNLIIEVAESYHTEGAPSVGIPLGNRTSQLFANVYLNELDQYVKNELRARWYLRYMDDFLIVHHDKRHLHKLRLHLASWLGDNLGLQLNHKTNVHKIGWSYNQGGGVDFLGYHLWPHGRRLRKASLKRFKRRVRRLNSEFREGKVTLPQVREQLSSWLAHARHGEAQKAVERFLNDHPFVRENYD